MSELITEVEFHRSNPEMLLVWLCYIYAILVHAR